LNDIIKNQHYVPQGYLKNFTLEGSDKRIWCFNKKFNKWSDNGIKLRASTNYFYELSEEYEKKFLKYFGYSSVNSTEKFLSIFESEVFPIIKNLIETCETVDEIKVIDLLYTEDYRVYLAMFIILQYYRTKKYRKRLYEKYYNEKKHELDGFERNYGFTLYQHSQNIKQLQKYAKDKSIMQQMVEIEDLNKNNELLNKIGNYSWFIGTNNYNIPLVTSDNPVVDMESYKIEDDILRAWAMPLNSKYVLIIVFDYFINRREFLSKTIKKLSLEEVNYLNKLQYQQLDEHIFSSIRFNDETFKS